MKILLVGGEGYIGSSFVKKFNDEFDLVIISSKKKSKKIAKTEYVSVTEEKIVEKIKKIDPDVVIHLAGFSGLKKCESEPEKAFEINVKGTLNVVKGCLKSDAKLIFISTREVYGETIDKRSKEGDILKPKNIYGKTKLEAEKIIQNAGIYSKLNYIILRLTNVYGPGSDSGINHIIKNSVEDRKIQLNGGQQILNFIFIEDVIELIRLVILDCNLSREIINIGSKESISLKKFVEILLSLLDDKIDIEIKDLPYFESLIFCPDIQKQQKILKYTLKNSLQEGIVKTIKHIKNTYKF